MDFSQSPFPANHSNSSNIMNSMMNQSADVLFLSGDHHHPSHGLTDGTDLTQVWILSLICSSLVGMTGLLPFILLPKDLNSSSSGLKVMLSFSVGALLGDVFLHLLPEAWSRVHGHSDNMYLGLYVLMGVFAFTLVEIMFAERDAEDARPCPSRPSSSPCDTQNNNHKAAASASSNSNMVTGYLNVMANGIDNFSHGLAVAASFLAGPRIGFITTMAILLHEVPHEFGDYAILMKSGFNKWEAAKAQASTAAIGILGAAFALTADATCIANPTTWMIPFTAGGFIHIALVSLLPDLIRDSPDYRQSVKQLLAVSAGVLVMALVNCFTH